MLWIFLRILNFSLLHTSGWYLLTSALKYFSWLTVFPTVLSFFLFFFFLRNSLQIDGLAVPSNRLCVYHLGLTIVRRKLCFLEKRLIWIHFSFRKDSIVYFLFIFIDETWQLRKSCVNKHVLASGNKFSHVTLGSNFQFCVCGKLLNGNRRGVFYSIIRTLTILDQRGLLF